MKVFRLVLCFAALALAAPGYKVTLTKPAILAGTVLQAGEYRIVVNGSTATVTSGKISLEVPVEVEVGAQKFQYTSVEGTKRQGKNLVEDIHIGGTTTTLIFKR
jgi:hypothetical protein